MSGYTPIFDSVFHGSLCGKWPTLPVWLTILPMADKHGQIDMSFQAMSALTGWPIDLLKQAITELCQPDPDSRSTECDGRRLELIDPDNRSWGWRVVNHGKYREKARKKMQQIEATNSGKDAGRKRVERGAESPAVSSGVQRCPAVSSADRLSDSDSDSDSEKNKSKDKLAEARSVAGLDQQAFQDWLEYRADRKPAIKTASLVACAKELAKFGSRQAETVQHSIANSYQGLFAPKASPPITGDPAKQQRMVIP